MCVEYLACLGLISKTNFTTKNCQLF